MRSKTLFCFALTLLTLFSPCWAEGFWKSVPDKLTLKAGDDFQKQTPTEKGISLELFSKAKNAQLLLTDSTQVSDVTTEKFIKAFPVLSTEKKLTVHAGPTKLKVSGNLAALYEIESEGANGYQTVYAYVGRGKTSYALILNYPSPRNPEMVKLMKQVLASVKHL